MFEIPSGMLLINNHSSLFGCLKFYNFHIHYANMSVQYTAIFHGCKNDYFQMKKCDNFLIFAQNIDCGYTLEPPR